MRASMARSIFSTMFTTNYIEKAINEFEELERIATEYESNKHYIELGKAVEKAFKVDLFSSLAISGDSLQSEVDLLEWAEVRSND